MAAFRESLDISCSVDGNGAEGVVYVRKFKDEGGNVGHISVKTS